MLDPSHNSPISYHAQWPLDELTGRRHELYLARLANIRQKMLAENVPVLLILDPNNIFYATGARNMQLWSFRSPNTFLLLFQNGPAILFEMRGFFHLSEKLPTIDRILPSIGLNKLGAMSSGTTVFDAAERFAKMMAETIREVDPAIDRLAVDRFPFPAIDALRAAGFHLTDADDVFTPARSIKLPIELPYMREAMRRVEVAVRSLEQNNRPGMTESEAWAEFHYDFMAKEGQYISTRLFQSGPNTFPYFQEADTRVLEKGDLLCLDTDALGYEGYAVDFSRTFLCGVDKATDEQRYLYDQARSQLEHNASLLRPGIAYRELAEKAWKIPEQHQKSRYYTLGHGLGMAGEFPNIPHFEPGEPYPLEGVIEPGQVICMESYIGSESSGQGVKLEDQFLILEDRVERMSLYHFDDTLGEI